MQPEFGNPSHAWTPGDTASVTLPEVMVAAAGGNVGGAAIGGSGALYGWGCNVDCAERFGPGADLPNPQLLTTPNDLPVQSVCMGYDYLCAVTNTGVIGCRGRNDAGTLGDGGTTGSNTYKIVPLVPPAAGVACGEAFACAWTPAGDVWCWGKDHVGELGRGPVASGGVYGPKSLGLTGVAEVSLGFQHACARKAPGFEVLCWGINAYGQLGIGVSGQFSTAQVVTGLPPGL